MTGYTKLVIDSYKRKVCVEIELQEHFEGDQFTSTKTGQLRLKADAVPFIFVHRPKPKRRKGPALRTTISLQHTDTVNSDHTYTELNFGMNNVKSKFSVFIGNPTHSPVTNFAI